jgi:AcrR family transcriptional regulator
VSEDPRDALLDVARQIIAKRGYVGLTMRTASAAAGVTEDVALRYYRNREALFAAAMRLPVDPVSAIPALMAPGIEGMGERLVRFTLDTLRDPEARDDLMSLARTGVSAGQAVTGLQDFIETGVVDRVAGMIGVPDARMRSALITSYLMGVATMRYGVRLEPLASASDEEVIRMVAPVIQDLLDPRRPIPGSTRARARSAAPHPGSPTPRTPSPRAARTFDPDPASTRRAAAASSSGAPAPSGGTRSPDRSRSTRDAATATTRSAATAATKAAARTATTSTPVGQPTGTGSPTAPTSPPATKESGTASPATSAAAKAPARKSPTTKPPAKKATTKKATAKKAPAKKAATKDPSAAAAAASPAGPKHAKDPADPVPT